MPGSTRFVAAMLATASLLPAVPLATAAQLCVNPGGTGGCFAAIQAAVDAAGNGDLVDVAAGTYSAGAVIPSHKRLTINGAGVGSTVLDGGGTTAAGFAQPHDGGRTLTIRSLSIRNFHSGVFSEHRIVLEDCEVSGSFAGGVVVSNGFATIRRCTISGNGLGGTLYNGGVSAQSLEIYSSTISGNTGTGVRGRYVRIEDSTISGNGKTGASDGFQTVGGGVDGSRVLLKRSTVAGNFVIDPDGSLGGGVIAGPRMTIDSSIIADNVADVGADCWRDPTIPSSRLRSSGFNLVEDGLVLCSGSVRPSDLLGVDPLLGSLQNNGGPTETHALLPGSPAIGAITSGSKCRRPDQRGVPRTPPCDIGAYEAP
jgi:hypothetical protein